MQARLQCVDCVLPWGASQIHALSCKEAFTLKFQCARNLFCAGPEKVPEARVLEVLRENKFNTNRAFELLEEELEREYCLLFE